MSTDQDKVVAMPPLVPDDAPAAAKMIKPEAPRAEGEQDTLARRVAEDPLVPDGREHTSAASPPKHM
jgi:hypothetical protein